MSNPPSMIPYHYCWSCGISTDQQLPSIMRYYRIKTHIWSHIYWSGGSQIDPEATSGECELTKLAFSCIRFVRASRCPAVARRTFNTSRSWCKFIDSERMNNLVGLRIYTWIITQGSIKWRHQYLNLSTTDLESRRATIQPPSLNIDNKRWQRYLGVRWVISKVVWLVTTMIQCDQLR